MTDKEVTLNRHRILYEFKSLHHPSYYYRSVSLYFT